MKLPNDDKWSLGTCKGKITPRSYRVKCAGRTYYQNHWHLRTTHEQQPVCTQHVPDTEDVESENGEVKNQSNVP